MSVHKKSGIPGFDPIRGELEAENERLRAENRTLREMVDYVLSLATALPRATADELEEWVRAAREALEGSSDG